MRVRYSRRARDDLNRLLADLEAQSPVGALNVGSALQRAVGAITKFPFAGGEIGRHGVLTRPVTGYPYLIFWTIAADEVRIVHIRHGSRKPWRG